MVMEMEMEIYLHMFHFQVFISQADKIAYLRNDNERHVLLFFFSKQYLRANTIHLKT